ncbi:Tryptophan--tRNA ligase [Nocardioides dokdonensis FR1436]|uniref:Tryptophan--tRNA ligase n=1 Tax=Nocardioides dokdonensis FR1436 TaxID=1300347 RepID=A0A1A9GHX2_9ACTN|nr:tryptophan--tRNA ligase [Nocardioides dokdonensis]ANH37270.1 Tryptophan--tRNA ligase [Nocardioides dokdonensis FR1436]
MSSTAPTSAARRLSLLTPSGHLTLGNLLGALRPLVAGQGDHDCFVGVSDLHAMTDGHDPAVLRSRSSELAALLVAVGLDDSTLFVQSRVPAHRQLAFLLECVASTGELGRMIQFKQRRRTNGSSRAALFTYPVLMAADILLYQPHQVPVGEDQRQHVELARDLALRFNRTYGPVFTVPEVAVAPAGARVMDLQRPTVKMSKSSAEPAGVIGLLDPPDVVRRKIARAVTDADTGPGAVRPDREDKPGITNLLDVLVACGGSPDGLSTYGALKRAVTDAVLGVLEPVQRRHAGLLADPAHLEEVYARGEARCREVTAPVLAAAESAMGL